MTNRKEIDLSFEKFINTFKFDTNVITDKNTYPTYDSSQAVPSFLHNKFYPVVNELFDSKFTKVLSLPVKMCTILEKNFGIHTKENYLSEYDYEAYDALYISQTFLDYGLYFDKDTYTVLYITISEYDLSVVCFNKKHKISYKNYYEISTDYFSYIAFYDKRHGEYNYDNAILLESFFQYTSFPDCTINKLVLHEKNYDGTLLNYIQKPLTDFTFIKIFLCLVLEGIEYFPHLKMICNNVHYEEYFEKQFKTKITNIRTLKTVFKYGKDRNYYEEKYINGSDDESDDGSDD